MKDFPSCFSENAVQVADSSSSNSNSTKHAQNLVLCVYQCIMKGKSCLISITWSKSLMGQGLSVGIDDSSNQCLCKVDIKPWLFSKRSGCKSLQAYYSKVDVFWDFSSAKFGVGPEPLEGFYVCVVLDRQMVMFLGDLKKKAYKKTNAIPLPCDAVFVAKKEHVFGKRLFSNKAVFCDNGQVHDLEIECDTSSVSDLRLAIRIDSKTVMQVKRLKWKFRGNCTILVDGFEVEVLWDVYNWLFGNATSLGNAVFMFRTCLNEDKWWDSSKPVSDENMLQSSLSKRFSETKLQGLGFSLMLYVWKNE